ncbi:MAG TPA: hypothetical protein VKF40_09265 [Burkholderiales bacterium]|nr:hypothetical protein [Burkholderiales bacterium]
MDEGSDVLYEITKTRQVAGEPRRRWFFSHEQDLLVWVGEDGTPVAFQLAYDKYRKERALRWKPEQGFSHYIVDDSRGTVGPRTPVLLEGGAFPAAAVLGRFIELSAGIPPDIAVFVAARLREHPLFRPWYQKPGVASGIALGLAIVVTGLVLAQLFRRER